MLDKSDITVVEADGRSGAIGRGLFRGLFTEYLYEQEILSFVDDVFVGPERRYLDAELGVRVAYL